MFLKKGGVKWEFNITNIINIYVILGKYNVKANWKTQELKLKDFEEGGRSGWLEGSTWMETKGEILSLFFSGVDAISHPSEF